MIMKIYQKVNSKKVYFILFLIVLALISSVNVFHSGLIYGDDINFHMHRIIAVADNMRIGKYVPVYFNYLNGFGYGNGLFYPDLFLIVPAFFNYLGLDIILSVKIFVIIINFVSICTMYLCVYRISKEKKCAYLSMILYAFSNYRLVDFVSRGALGEMISFIFFPLVVLGLYEIFFGDSKKGYYLTIGLSGLCFSHVISFYLMCFFAILFMVLNIKCLNDKLRLKFLVFYILLAMLITVHFWLPMFEQMLSGRYSIDVHREIFKTVIPIYFVFLDLPYNAITNYYIAGIGVIYYIGLFKCFDKLRNNKFLFTIFVLGILSVLFVSCKLVWEIDLFYNVFSVIQFPWRFYMFTTVFFIIVFSIIFKNVGFNRFVKLCLVYIILIFVVNTLLYSYNVYLKQPLDDEIMMGEYLPKNFDYSVFNDYSNKYIDYERKNGVLNVSIKKSKKEIEVPLIYYKGYKACGNKCYDVFKSDKGLVGVKLDDDIKDLKVWYSGTELYSVTKYFSAFGFLILLYIVRKYRYCKTDL